MRVLVTGANGHIGCNLLPVLIEEGHEVVPFVRASSDTSGIDNLGLEYARGDVQDRDSLMTASENCDAIIHMAAVYSMSNDPAVVMEPAIAGSKNVVDAAQKHGIKRIVYTSSTVSIGTQHAPKEMDESFWSDDAVLPYAIAKRESERAATSLAAAAGVELIVLNPTSIIGPLDHRITPSSEMFVNWLTNRMQAIRGGGSWVDVRDVALAHARALTRGAAGERHILCSHNYLFRDLVSSFDRLFGAKPMYMPAPRWMLIPMSYGLEAGCALFGVKPPYTHTQVQEWLDRFAWFDGSKATDVFGFEYRDIDESLKDTVLWIAQKGAFPKNLNAKLLKRLAA